MGLSDNWRSDFISGLTTLGVKLVPSNDLSPNFIFTENEYAFLLTDIQADLTAASLIQSIAQFAAKNIKLIHIWEDVWHRKHEQVLGRLRSILGFNTRMHARKCSVGSVSSARANAFHELNHLQGAVKAEYNLGLFFNEELIAVASFNQQIMSSRGPNHRSSELVRFCTLPGNSIVGGLSKLINGHRERTGFEDLMTYADKEWSDGGAYIKLGFKKVGDTPPVEFYVDLLNMTRFTKKQAARHPERDMIKIFNAGNIKFILWHD